MRQGSKVALAGRAAFTVTMVVRHSSGDGRRGKEGGGGGGVVYTFGCKHVSYTCKVCSRYLTVVFGVCSIKYLCMPDVANFIVCGRSISQYVNRHLMKPGSDQNKLFEWMHNLWRKL